MFGRKKATVDAENLIKVMGLIPLFVEALVDEHMGAHAMKEGLDGREIHGPAVRKLERIDAEIHRLLGENGHKKHKEAQKEGLSCSKVRKFFSKHWKVHTEETKERKAGHEVPFCSAAVGLGDCVRGEGCGEPDVETEPETAEGG
jgi:hypothetical protein